MAYFLSRGGQRRVVCQTPSPPPQLQVSSWEEAYELFFPRLHGGRSRSVFHHSMKNARDTFDGHHDSGRRGLIAVGLGGAEVRSIPLAITF